VLGVGPRASRTEIKKAYRALAARYHPDKHQGNELEDLARDKLAQINEAFRVLDDPELRRAYDAARIGPRVAAGPEPRPGDVPTPSRRSPLDSWGGLVAVVLLIAALPLLLRFVRNPRAVIAIGIALALAWFGPRIWRYFKR